MIKIITAREKETFTLGRCIAKVLEKGDIVCLTGDLGAGKTTISKSIAKEIGIDEYITSPTFTIVNEYEGKVKLNHFDVYRISDVEEMYEIGYEEYFFSDAINIIEWANLVEEIIPENNIWIDIRLGEDYNHRVFTIKSGNSFVKEKVNKIQNLWNEYKNMEESNENIVY
ncbi:tRNA (adenosine(37)-N6)-threonylcarbamoyltransferase complex ATPase subunit type 1 TsaE [Helicovermis profundi]|uniref:tRNA threonylcarbamoyladenosine biosynthesis protein TsaE n=1 Tax=Helicovermis profundi TaxID=3065157 RepID=A0AAU9EES2_9FIRM|nr:tRNA (adenosine(37)-N6)-threonylcarbamoyltransferase complex ATPase subunit type 1 TsaE [Clostridia bacterium S502]